MYVFSSYLTVNGTSSTSGASDETRSVPLKEPSSVPNTSSHRCSNVCFVSVYLCGYAAGFATVNFSYHKFVLHVVIRSDPGASLSCSFSSN